MLCRCAKSTKSRIGKKVNSWTSFMPKMDLALNLSKSVPKKVLVPINLMLFLVYLPAAAGMHSMAAAKGEKTNKKEYTQCSFLSYPSFNIDVTRFPSCLC